MCVTFPHTKKSQVKLALKSLRQCCGSNPLPSCWFGRCLSSHNLTAQTRFFPFSSTWPRSGRLRQPLLPAKKFENETKLKTRPNWLKSKKQSKKLWFNFEPFWLMLRLIWSFWVKTYPGENSQVVGFDKIWQNSKESAQLLRTALPPPTTIWRGVNSYVAGQVKLAQLGALRFSVLHRSPHKMFHLKLFGNTLDQFFTKVRPSQKS